MKENTYKMRRCDVCLKEKPDVKLEPSRSQLLFGGFHVKLENRCKECEQDVLRWVRTTLTGIPPTSTPRTLKDKKG